MKIGAPGGGRPDRGARAGQGPPAGPQHAARHGRGDGGLGATPASTAAQEAGDLDGDRVGVAMATGIGGVTTLLSQLRHPAREGPAPGLPARRADADGQRSRRQRQPATSAPAPRSTRRSRRARPATRRSPWPIDQIRLGRADVVVAGGTEAAIHPLPMAAFANMMALSKTATATPTTVSRPWDTGRDGFVLGEGAGVLVLESEEHARARGAHIYAEVLGAGITADSHDIAQPDPAGSRRLARDQARAARVRHRPARRSSTSTPTRPRRRRATSPRA